MKKINTSTLLISILVIILIVGAVVGGIFFAKSKNLVLVPKTNTVSNTNTVESSTNQNAVVDPLDSRVDLDSEISEMDKSISSTKDDEFNEESLSDAEVGI